MKQLTTLTLLFFPFFLLAQSQLEINLSPDISFRTVSETKFRDNESAKFNYHFQLNYIENISSKWALKMGIGFAQLGYKEKISNVIFGDQILTGQPTSDPLASKSAEFKYDYQFIEIPASIQYNFSRKKWSPFVAFGISTSYYIKSIDNLVLDNETISTEKYRDEGFVNHIQIASIFSFGATYKINDKWQTFLQPNFRFHLTKISDSSVKERLWSGGVAWGMRMRLK